LNVFRSMGSIFVWFSLSIGSPSNPESFPGGTPFRNQAEHEGKPESERTKRDERAKTRAFRLPSGLRNGGRPWLRFEVGQFACLATFKKFSSQFPQIWGNQQQPMIDITE
jgi:hypothetical protein